MVEDLGHFPRLPKKVIHQPLQRYSARCINGTQVAIWSKQCKIANAHSYHFHSFDFTHHPCEHSTEVWIGSLNLKKHSQQPKQTVCDILHDFTYPVNCKTYFFSSDVYVLFTDQIPILFPRGTLSLCKNSVIVAFNLNRSIFEGL